MDQTGTTFNRWQIQCKNTRDQLAAKHIAREVGIARILQTNTILMIARGGVSDDGRRYANRVMQHENISIVFLTGEDIHRLSEGADHLLTVLRGESDRIQNLKQLDPTEVEAASSGGDEGDKAEAVEEALSEYEEELSTEVDQGELTDF